MQQGLSAASAMGVCGLAGTLRASSAKSLAGTRWALLSDTHISADASKVSRDVNMADNLKKVVAQLVARKDTLQGVIISGDLALGNGQAGDYETLTQLLEPVSQAGLPIHMLLGNHDNRANFRRIMKGTLKSAELMESHHVTAIDTPDCEFYLLDSLDQVDKVPGLIGKEQLSWLARKLSAKPATKPRLVIVHHHPQFNSNDPISGIQDTKDLWSLITDKAGVNGLIFGHTHDWSHHERDNVHLINLPPVAYVFAKGKPNGWVEVAVDRSTGITFTLETLDPEHANHHQQVKVPSA